MRYGTGILPLIVPSLDAYANKMVHDLFDGTKGFAIDGGIKDSTHIRKLAAEVNSPMPALVRNVVLVSAVCTLRPYRIRRINTY